MGTRFVAGVLLGIVLCVSWAGTVAAQTPFIAVYFDEYYTRENAFSPGVGVVDTWYAVMKNFNTLVSGAEFMVEYPPAVIWLADNGTPPVTIGNTPSGISMGFGVAMNGFEPILCCSIMVMWMSECDHEVQPVRVLPNPHTLFLGGTDFPAFDLIPAVGLTTFLCGGGTPAQDTTWGSVKALYSD